MESIGNAKQRKAIAEVKRVGKFLKANDPMHKLNQCELMLRYFKERDDYGQAAADFRATADCRAAPDFPTARITAKKLVSRSWIMT